MNLTLNTKLAQLLDEVQKSGGLSALELPRSLIMDSPAVIIIIAIGDNHVRLMKEKVIPQLDAATKLNKPNGKEL